MLIFAKVTGFEILTEKAPKKKAAAGRETMKNLPAAK